MPDSYDNGYAYGYGSAVYGYGADGYYGYGYYGYGYFADPIYGYMNSVTDPSTGYTHTHSMYATASGSYYHTIDDDRGPAFDRSVQITRNSYGGNYRTDILTSSTELNGTYYSYGTRYTSSYDISTHIATTNNVYFAQGYSFSDFHSINYETGASINSEDTRYFYSYGFYEYNTSTYNGPGGYNYASTAAYHYSYQ